MSKMRWFDWMLGFVTVWAFLALLAWLEHPTVC